MAISYSGCTCGASGGGACECTPECVETVCVLRCDDTNGDGAPDTTYSELWCVKLDGETQLVLTYQDDPAVPYTPVSPVDCQQGSMQCHNQVLCDDSGSFIRRYTFVSDGTAAYVDVQLDGETPHIVTGTVRACDDNPCKGQDAPLATLGLCLADGTPIAVIVTRNCDGTVQQQGWINLTTGAYSAGAPPVGVTACGETRSVSTTGTFCDILDDGTVAGLVLIEYTYGPDGTVTGVRLVDATTGSTYQPRGTVTACPTGDEQPEQDLVVLCEIRPDGEVVRFLRDYRRDQTGTITGHTNYTLDGAPYQPAPGADIGTCPPDCGVQQVIQTDRCDDTNGDGLPDVWYVELLGVDCQGTVSPLGTYTCDLSEAYEPVAPVDCDTGDGEAPQAEPCDTAYVQLCDVTADGTTPFLRRIAFTCSGAVLDTTDVRLDRVTRYDPVGTVGVCDSISTPGAVLREERCDDTDSDGLPDIWYTELIHVDSKGALTPLGTYTCDLSGPYEPVAPVDCDPDTAGIAALATGGDGPAQIRAHRVQLTPGGTWSSTGWPLLRAIEASARGGHGEITTADGTTTLFDGEQARWATSRDTDVRLTGPLTIAATTGTVTINFTTGVTP